MPGRLFITLTLCVAHVITAVALLATPASAHADPTSSTAPEDPPTTTSTAPSATPQPLPAPLRTPPANAASSPINVPVDEETAEFRAELARRQQLLDEFLAQLDALDRELSVAAEAHNAAVARLEATRQQIARTEVDLANAEHAFAVQMELLNNRTAEMYKKGSINSIVVLLGSESFRDLIARVQFLNTIGSADAQAAEKLRAQRDLVRKAADELQKAQVHAESLEFELKARQLEIMARIQDRQEMLANAQMELLELLDEHAAQRQTEEAALLRSILSGANEAGIRIEPGSPVETAFAYYGVPYLWGGKNPAGFDCSGLLYYTFKQHGVELPHYSGAQFLRGERIPPAALQPGDAVFFGSPIHHVGIYVGGGYFIHAPRTGDFVRLAPLAERRDYAGARRYNWVPRTAPPSRARVNPAAPFAAIR